MSARATTAIASAQPEVVACWSEIGVFGNRSCQELERHVHCHHCPVFSEAARRLLDRPLAADYRAERTRDFSVEREPGESKATSAVVFRIRSEWLALPTSALQEITEQRTIHSLPHRRTGALLGLANFRGELLLCVSLGHLLGVEGMVSPEELRRASNRVLVTHWEGSRLAFPVDEVHGPHRFEPHAWRRLPASLTDPNPSYTRHILSWRNRAVGLLDPGLLFSTWNRTWP